MINADSWKSGRRAAFSAGWEGRQTFYYLPPLSVPGFDNEHNAQPPHPSDTSLRDIVVPCQALVAVVLHVGVEGLCTVEGNNAYSLTNDIRDIVVCAHWLYALAVPVHRFRGLGTISERMCEAVNNTVVVTWTGP